MSVQDDSHSLHAESQEPESTVVHSVPLMTQGNAVISLADSTKENVLGTPNEGRLCGAIDTTGFRFRSITLSSDASRISSQRKSFKIWMYFMCTGHNVFFASRRMLANYNNKCREHALNCMLASNIKCL